MRARRARARFALGAVALAACADEAPPALTVGPLSYTNEQLLGLTGARRQTLAELASLALAVADSSAAELGAPLVSEWIDDRLLEILAAELTLEEHAVGEAELLDAYREAPQWELGVRHVLVFSERWRASEHRSAAEAKAARARALLEGGMDFADVEARFAGEPGGEARAGLLPPSREGAWVPEFWAAALALDPGQLSPVTETQYGYHVLRLESRSVVPFPEARSGVARRLARALEDPRGVLETWMAASGGSREARRAAALSEARSRGLHVPPGERAEIARRWEDQVAQWAGALGFTYGLGLSQVADAALAALARTGQAADIARREIASHGALLRARYVVRVGTEVAAAP